MNDCVDPTTWACLWLSSIDNLREIVKEAQDPKTRSSVLLKLQGMAINKVVQRCMWSAFCKVNLSLTFSLQGHSENAESLLTSQDHVHQLQYLAHQHQAGRNV